MATDWNPRGEDEETIEVSWDIEKRADGWWVRMLLGIEPEWGPFDTEKEAEMAIDALSKEDQA